MPRFVIADDWVPRFSIAELGTAISNRGISFYAIENRITRKCAVKNRITRMRDYKSRRPRLRHPCLEIIGMGFVMTKMKRLFF